MASDAAMKVWLEAIDTYLQKAGPDDNGAAAVIERAIADAVAQERAKAEALADRSRRARDYV